MKTELDRFADCPAEERHNPATNPATMSPRLVSDAPQREPGEQCAESETDGA